MGQGRWIIIEAGINNLDVIFRNKSVDSVCFLSILNKY
jgi:hypothetical protein